LPFKQLNEQSNGMTQGTIVMLRHQRKRSERTVQPPTRKPNSELRTREYLTPDEVDRLVAAVGASGRHRSRDQALLTLMYRHGLRVSEAVSLRWDQVDLKAGLLHVNRLKNGVPSTHPLRGPEIRRLRHLKRDWPDSPYLFVSERGGPMTASNVRKLVSKAGRVAALPFPVHPHMFRHACGFKLANDGHDTRALQHYLGHRNILHTVRYTEMAPERFRSFWKD
jgi:type 1 fimbriae regulatory protein FimB/type 1 fimbriae regulatory protein FimE